MNMFYIGPVAALHGKTAMVMSCPDDRACDGPWIQAQFNDQSLVVDGVRLFADWHRFPRAHFSLSAPVLADAVPGGAA